MSPTDDPLLLCFQSIVASSRREDQDLVAHPFSDMFDSRTSFSSSSSSDSSKSISPSLSSFPLTPSSSQATEPPSPKRGFVFSPTTPALAPSSPQYLASTSFKSSSSDKHPSPRPSIGSSTRSHTDFGSSSLNNHSSFSSSTSNHLLPPLDPISSFMSASVVDAAENEDSCPICLELLSLRLAGEKPHVVPVCGHRLRELPDPPPHAFSFADSS